LKTIVTTNFDYLIERALKEENVNFSVYYGLHPYDWTERVRRVW